MLLHRPMPSPEALDIVELVRDVAHKQLEPRAADAEREERFPRETFRAMGELGLLGMPYAEEHGGGDQPAEVYLQVIEELGAAWATIGLGVSVHTLACLPIAKYGTDDQRDRWLPGMLGGELLGAYCLSEAHAGSDPAAMITRATRRGDEYVISGAKAWTTHGGQADFYTVLARTSDDGGPWHLVLPRAGRHPGTHVVASREQDGAHRIAHDDHALRRRRHPGRPPRRR